MPLLSSAAIWFDEVARHGSIRRAAERLNASPSAVNRQILLLEAEYGVPLFERLPRGVRLTAAGEVLINDVRRWRHDDDRTRGQLDDLRGLRRGHVSIGLMECLSATFMPQVFADLHRQHPRLTFGAFVGGTDRIVEDLQAGTLDMGICFNLPHSPNVQIVHEVAVPMGVVVPVGHPLAGLPSVRLSDCIPYPIILPDRALTLRSMIDAALVRLNHRPIPPITTNSIALIKGAVRRGEGLGFLTSLDVLDEPADGGLIHVPLAENRLSTEHLSVCVRELHSPPAATLLLADAVQTALAGALMSTHRPTALS
ncbi:LysR family transcriptional regulator [Telmatospirillum sp.]|uniref:LysR family transcriptional regulator n=1 Tax=Telmatospirillum sp. TaxID=2079197 RepID=UPI002842BD5F|nr:LysR family transcriptional regulator [Telmatospirillum sp.]MDR3437912.1 LysR family transcriptional regulator [Telmatospirillum sp.]